ncbi:MAG: 16S rRNA processing protein RimM [Clostridiales bacterium]|nr:16S rRNA processing protein RimM [Clostridiales bacterium]
MNLLEVGKILRPHGVKGAVKIESYVDEPFSFKNILLTQKLAKAKVKGIQNLNNGFYVLTIDMIPDIDTAEKYRNQSIYIDREEYVDFKDKVYLSDLLHSPVLDKNGETLGEMIDFDDYGASVILTIKCGVTSYTIPFVPDIIVYDKERKAFVIDKQTFEDVRV